MKPTAFVHMDLDGLSAIYRGHGQSYAGDTDPFYVSAMENALEFFDEEGIRATLFVIAEDLDQTDKRHVVEEAVRRGHQIACHGHDHRYLMHCSDAEQRVEIIGGRDALQDRLGVPVKGFRAPGYSIDFRALNLLREAGYQYDSSILPTFAFRERLGIQRLFPEPFLLWPESGLFEIPLPAPGPFQPPFHPCYSMYLGRWYFNRSFERFAQRHNYFTLLLHLTDFADRLRLNVSTRLNIYTNNYRSAPWKHRFLSRVVKRVRTRYDISTTEAFLEGWPDSAPDLNPRVVLGISTTHETGACVVRDGTVVSAINEERLTRNKLDARYPPTNAIREAIRISGIEPQEIEAVSIAGLRWNDLLPQTLKSFWQDVRDYHSLNDYIPHLCRIAYRAFYFWRALRYGAVADFLRREYGISPKVYYVEHHEAHASSVYRTGAHPRALIVTADGVGDDVCITFSEAEGSLIRRLETFYYPNSFGQFYTACTQILGFKGGRHEGKITGLSGFGHPDDQLLSRVERTFMNGDGFKLHKRYFAEGFLRPRVRQMAGLVIGRTSLVDIEYRNYKKPLARLLRGFPREDVAYVFQLVLEREMTRLTRTHWRAEHGSLALAGGIFANVKLNMAMTESVTPEATYIFPNMGDGGLGVGAALAVASPMPKPLGHVYLGSAPDESEILETLQAESEVTWRRPENLTEAIADHLAAGKIVARASGPMEYGPRALGNRSILYHCADPSVNDWLNKQLGRTEFMPFAPICRWEDAEEYFQIQPGDKRACEFMTLVVRCTDRMREVCPAAVHVDGTARPQLVRREVNPDVHAVLTSYHRRTGIGCLINTSFNMHEEPIVRTPAEAIQAFRQSRLDFLVLGPFLVEAR